MREKWHWNQRIHQLGGIDYNALERKRQIEEGGDAAQQRQRGYKYFGRAKELPGVKELLEKEETKDTKKQSARSVYQRITPDYYGWRDEEDGVLLELETLATKQNDQLHKRRRIGESGEQEDQDDEEVLPPDYLDVPSQAEIDQALLEQRKKSFLAKYNI
jgi:pre-mRNA-splicing factor ISY1